MEPPKLLASLLQQVDQHVHTILEGIESHSLPQSRNNGDSESVKRRKIFWGVQKISKIIDGVLRDSLGVIVEQSSHSGPGENANDDATPSEFCYFMEKSISSDKTLSVAGVLAIKDLVANSNLYKCSVQASLLEVANDQWPAGAHNPVFCYEDNPFPCWRKEISLRLSGKSMGATTVYFIPPVGGRRIRTKDELNSYLLKNNLSLSLASRFEFNSSYCVCQTRENKSCTYIECSFGKGGCNGWLHSRCVGMGECDAATLDKMPSVICPFCAAYLKGSGQLQLYEPTTM
jgi:hypothetical protein